MIPSQASLNHPTLPSLFVKMQIEKCETIKSDKREEFLLTLFSLTPCDCLSSSVWLKCIQPKVHISINFEFIFTFLCVPNRARHAAVESSPPLSSPSEFVTGFVSTTLYAYSGKALKQTTQKAFSFHRLFSSPRHVLILS